jgi:hypothetical protein
VERTLYQFNRDDHFDYRLQRMHESLKELSDIIDQQQRRPIYLSQIVTRKVVYEWKPPKRKSGLMFPFSLLAQAIDGCLNQLDRAVCLFVQRVIARWLYRLRLLRPRKRLA